MTSLSWPLLVGCTRDKHLIKQLPRGGGAVGLKSYLIDEWHSILDNPTDPLLGSVNIHRIVFSMHSTVLSAHYVLGTILATEDTAVHSTH